jgi:hypothetical protein
MAQQVFKSFTGLNKNHDATAIDRSKNGKVIYVPAEHRGNPGYGAPELTVYDLLTDTEARSTIGFDEDLWTKTAGGNWIQTI